MRKQLVKVCALCDHTVPYHQIVCYQHLDDLELYRDELWFQELVAAQQRQYEIDISEIKAANFSVQIEPMRPKTDSKPRKKLPITVVMNIMTLYKKGMGWRKIAKRLKLPPYTVKSIITRKLGRKRSK